MKNSNTPKRTFLSLITDEKYITFVIPIIAIILSLFAGAIIILLVGKNPFTAYYSLLQGSGLAPKPSYAKYKSTLTDFMGLLNALTPMLFAALAVAVALKAGLFNIGVAGQMLTSGFIATILVGYSGLSAFVAKPLVLVVGVVVGALCGSILGFLRYRFNINEVVSSIMLNYIFLNVISFFINSYYVDPVSRQSRAISTASRLTLMDFEAFGLKMELPLGIILAVIVVFAVRYLLYKTYIGFEVKAVGANPKAAKYAGINVGRTMVFAMTLSGALAGLAGVTYYLGYFGSIQPKVLASMGFDAIAVCLLGNSNPVGIIFSSALITTISRGASYMSSSAGIAQEISSVITGTILLFSACGAYLSFVLLLLSRSKKRKSQELDALEQFAAKQGNENEKGGEK